MLESQHRRRGQDCRLLPVHEHLEDGPHRHLGFAEADVATDEPVHRLVLLQVLFDRLDRCDLIRRFDIRKRFLQLPLPHTVRRVRMAGGDLARRIQLQQPFGDVAHGATHPTLGPFPVAAAEPVQRRLLIGSANVFVHPVELIRRDVEAVVAGILQQQVLALATLAGQRHQLDIAPDAVVNMHYIVARL